MKRVIIISTILRRTRIVLLLMASLALMSFRTADERAAEALAHRVMGDKAKAVVFEQMDAETDSYELLQRGNKVLIWGNNANSMAVGLNRYIQQYCLANVSWYHFNPVELPATMPQVPSIYLLSKIGEKLTKS